MYRVGCCITAHGFGHASRSLAVMEALAGLVDVHFVVAAKIPEWFFRSSYPGTLELHPVRTDVGLVQRSALEIDLPATMERLAAFYPLSEEAVQDCAALFADCDLLICDISPLGIKAAGKIGVPSVLVENFTWDWIYAEYLKAWPQIDPYIRYLERVYKTADYHIQAEPVCAGKECDLRTAPIARKIRCNRESVRRMLAIPPAAQLVLVSMGGEGAGELPLAQMRKCSGTVFLVPGRKAASAGQDNVLFLPDNAPFFHPDLVAAADGVIGKVGYSTLAEVYHAGVPYGYIARPDFRESAPLVRFIEENMSGLPIAAEDFERGVWLDCLPDFFARKKGRAAGPNGADQCAGFIAGLLHSRSEVL